MVTDRDNPLVTCKGAPSTIAPATTVREGHAYWGYRLGTTTPIGSLRSSVRFQITFLQQVIELPPTGGETLIDTLRLESRYLPLNVINDDGQRLVMEAIQTVTHSSTWDEVIALAA